MVLNCEKGDCVLVTDRTVDSQSSESAIDELRKRVGETGTVLVHNYDFLLKSKLIASESCNVVASLLNFQIQSQMNCK